jgi:3-isopropylmalate/(R)-2-methylmalate dehydratase small subunit
MAAFRSTTSRVVALIADDIDTDQIIPARFLKGTSKSGLGERLFNDWRSETDGSPKPGFVLNQPDAKGASVLLAGHNFGCGSSREHAPWALVDFGFRAIVATSFADIFKSNALKNGLLPVAIDAATHQRLAAMVAKDPSARVTVDLESTTLRLPDGTSATFPVDPFSRRCLLDGVDELGYLLSQVARIDAFEAARGGAAR